VEQAGWLCQHDDWTMTPGTEHDGCCLTPDPALHAGAMAGAKAATAAAVLSAEFCTTAAATAAAEAGQQQNKGIKTVAALCI
jgi:hypothetical protein